MADDTGHDANPNPEQHLEGALNDTHSRRKFLRAAAIGAAGVAGVAGAVGVAGATGKLTPNTLRHFTGGPQTLSTNPPPPTIDGFFEETTPGPCLDTTKSSYSSGHTNRYIVFYISNLPKGNYTFDVTQSCNGHTAGPIKGHGHGTSTLQWEYKTDSSQVHVVLYNANSKPSCPTDLSGNKSLSFDSFTVSWGPTAFGANATQDVAIFAHIIDNQSPLASTTSFTGTLSGDKSLSLAVNVHS